MCAFVLLSGDTKRGVKAFFILFFSFFFGLEILVQLRHLSFDEIMQASDFVFYFFRKIPLRFSEGMCHAKKC